MSDLERCRLSIFSRVKDQSISVVKAAELLDLSERQARRLWKRYRLQSDAGLIHGLRGRAGNAGHTQLKEQVLAAYRARYREFSAAHALEFLAKEKLRVSRTTCWRWLKAAGLIANPRKVKQHRQRREPKAALGEMIQMDGSTHAWFGPDHPPAVLFVMIDDATSQVLVRFYATEDTATAFDLFGRYARRFGLPLSLYVDRDSIYRVNDAEALQKAAEAGLARPLTQFGRAMKQLGVRMIFARTPQAKGRVERVNRTCQDRLVKELKLLGITTIQQANVYLEKTFSKSLNRLIRRVPASGANLHQAVPQSLRLEDVLCVIQERAVGQDWCVRFAGRILQIQKKHQPLALAGKWIRVLARADGSLKLVHQDRALVFVELASRPVEVLISKPAVGHIPQHPAANHPWNKSFKEPRRKVPSGA
jgi:transposase